MQHEILELDVTFEVSESAPLATTQVWHDLTEYLHDGSSLVIDRGRTSETDEVRAGTLTCTLDVTDRALDPSNLSSPYADCLKVRRRCRVTVDYDGTPEVLFSGFTHGWPRSYQRPNLRATIPFQASDGMRVLQNPDPQAGSFRFDDNAYGRFDIGRFAGANPAVLLSGEFVTAILDGVTWPAAERDIAEGVVVVVGDPSAGASAAIQAAVAAEGGAFYFDREGVATFRDRHADYTSTRSNTVQASFSPWEDVPPAYDGPLSIEHDDSRLVNRAVYTGASEVPQTSVNLFSIVEHGVGEDSQSLIARDDTRVKALGALRVSRYAYPRDRIETFAVNAHSQKAAAYPAVLGRELFDLIEFEHEPPGASSTTVEALVQGIRHELGKASFVTTFRLGPKPTEQFFTFDHSTRGQFGGVGVLAP